MRPSSPEGDGGAPREDDSAPKSPAIQQLEEGSNKEGFGSIEGATTSHQSITAAPAACGPRMSDDTTAPSRQSRGPPDRLVSDDTTASSRKSPGPPGILISDDTTASSRQSPAGEKEQEEAPAADKSDKEAAGTAIEKEHNEPEDDDEDKKPAATEETKPWGTRIKQLIEFKSLHGHCQVPVGYPPNPKLSNWVSTQRQEKKAFDDGRPSRLDSKKVKILEDLGFAWEVQRGGNRKQTSQPGPNVPMKRSSSGVDGVARLPEHLRRLPHDTRRVASMPFVEPSRGVDGVARLPEHLQRLPRDTRRIASMPSSESSSGVDGVARLPVHLRGLSSDMLAARGSINPSAREQERRMMMALQEGAEQERLLRAMEREQILQQQQDILLASQIQSINQQAFPPYAVYPGLFSLGQGQSLPLGMPTLASVLPFSSAGLPLQSRNMLVQPQLSGMEQIPGRRATEHSLTDAVDRAELASLLRRLEGNPSRRHLQGESLLDRERLTELLLQQNEHQRDEGDEFASEEVERGTKRSRQG